MDYWIIYTLKLQDSCWYIGRTTQRAFKQRMISHWNGNREASNFTKLHKPIRIYDIQIHPRSLTNAQAEVFENEQTLRIAKLRGFDLVRGGGYTQDKPQWPTLTQLTLS